MRVASNPPRHPTSATPEPLAEDGSCNPRKRTPNLRLRRPHTQLAENGGYRRTKRDPNLHHRRLPNRSPKTEDGQSSQSAETSVFGDKSKGRRRRKIHTPKTRPKPPQSATPHTTRRRWKIQTLKKDPKPPTSATPCTARNRNWDIRRDAIRRHNENTHGIMRVKMLAALQEQTRQEILQGKKNEMKNRNTTLRHA